MTCQRDAPLECRPCRYCGQLVMSFEDELGCQRYLEVTEPPARTHLTLPGVQGRVWELSPYKSIGWQLQDQPHRSWRPVRLEHWCPGNSDYLAGRPMKVGDHDRG